MGFPGHQILMLWIGGQSDQSSAGLLMLFVLMDILKTNYKKITFNLTVKYTYIALIHLKRNGNSEIHSHE